MKVVLDTNVLLSGIFFAGPPYSILRAWREGKFDLVLSREIFDEYRQAAASLAESCLPVDLQDILTLIETEAEFCEAPPLSEPVCADPDDDKFLACALAKGVQVIVSGDKHLLKVSGFHGIQVLRPRVFLDTFLT